MSRMTRPRAAKFTCVSLARLIADGLSSRRRTLLQGMDFMA